MNTPKSKGNATVQKKGIRSMLFAYLAVFCAVVLLLIWIVQVFLLDSIYHGILLYRMGEAATTLTSVVESDDPRRGADAVAVNYEVSIAVFRVENDMLAERVLMADGAAGSVLAKLKNAEYADLYRSAKENGGTATKDFAVQYTFGPETRPGKTVTSHRLVYVSLQQTVDGTPIALFLDAAIIPQGAQSGAVMVEMILLSLLFVIAALVLAHEMSKRIAAPLAGITAGAKQLADGRYDTHFESDGCREIEELSNTLNYAAQELSKVDNLQKELIANVSHDLRTPLTTIIGYAEVMRDIEGENKPENMQVIIDEAKRLSDLVNDLLEISRHSADGKTPVVPQEFDMHDLVRETADRYRQMLEKDGFLFKTEIGDTPMPVTADRARIAQVLNNLIHNAVNYSSENKEITLTCTKTEDGYTRVEVIDRGEGIPADKLPHIWQRYYKVDRRHKRSVVGSGLGLSIVQGILEAHFARYGVDSRVGDGSRFWFELPPKGSGS